MGVIDPNESIYTRSTSGDPISTLPYPFGAGGSTTVKRPSPTSTGGGSGSLGAPKYQEAFDKRMLDTPLLKGRPLQRGFMFQQDPLLSSLGQKQPLGLRFLYNPESVSINYAINTDIYPPYQQPETSGNHLNAPIGIPGSANLSFSLLFDRTYDCWGPRKASSLASRGGVYHDVQQFEKMLGYTEDSPFVTIVAMLVYFGHDGIRFYGYVTGFDVVYTTWTQDMRPTRCGINVSMAVLPYGVSGKDFANTNLSGADAFTTNQPPSASNGVNPDGTTFIPGTGRTSPKNATGGTT